MAHSFPKVQHLGMRTHTHARTHERTHARTHTRARAHRRIHTRMNQHTHTHMHASSRRPLMSIVARRFSPLSDSAGTGGRACPALPSRGALLLSSFEAPQNLLRCCSRRPLSPLLTRRSNSRSWRLLPNLADCHLSPLSSLPQHVPSPLLPSFALCPLCPLTPSPGVLP